MAEPNEAADIARLFSKTLSGTSEPQMGKFLIYEEYGAMYAEVVDASASVSRSMPDWVVFERGIEALVHHVLQPGSTPRAEKKGLTLEDLLIKVRDIEPYSLSELTELCRAASPKNLQVSVVVCRSPKSLSGIRRSRGSRNDHKDSGAPS